MTVSTWATVSIAVACGRVIAMCLIARVGFNPSYPRLVRVAVFVMAVAAFLPISIARP